MSSKRVGLMMLLGCLIPSDQSMALPPTTDLVGCPFVDSPSGPAPEEAWVTRTLEQAPASIEVPASWGYERDGRSLTLESPDGQTWMSLRIGRPGDEGHLDRVRDALELWELGPTHLTPRCEVQARAWLQQVGGWSDIRLSVTRRAFGMPRRSFALVAPLQGATLTAIVTVKWRSNTHDVMDLVRRLFSGIRAHREDAPGAALAPVEVDPKG